VVRTNSLLILVVAVVMGGIAAFLARSWLLSRTQGATAAGIIVAATELPYGTPLTDDNVKEVQWTAGVVPNGAFSSKQALFKEGRRITLAAIQQNEPILSSRITGPGQRASLSTLLDADKRAITIRVDDVRGVAGFILPNDRVDVVLIRSVSDTGGRKDYSDLLLQDVKVIAIDQVASQQKDNPVVARAVTLEVTPYQAQKISLATNVGHLSLILRKAGDANVVADHRVTEADLNEVEAAVVTHPSGAAPAPAAPPAPSLYSDVTIIRNLKGEDYKVFKEGR